MFFKWVSEVPMLLNFCSMPFSSLSLHINPKALMLRFTNDTLSYNDDDNNNNNICSTYRYTAEEFEYVIFPTLDIFSVLIRARS